MCEGLVEGEVYRGDGKTCGSQKTQKEVKKELGNFRNQK